MTDETVIQADGELRTIEPGQHISLPSGSTSAFAVGDTVTVREVTQFGDEDSAATAEANSQLAGASGEVLAVVYLLEQGLFAYYVQLPVGRLSITPQGGIQIDNLWPLLERELTTVVANGAE